jgi:hypothetical protein
MRGLAAAAAVLGLVFAPVAVASPAPPSKPLVIEIGGHGDASGSGVDYSLWKGGFTAKGVKTIRIAYLADGYRGEESTADGAAKLTAAWQANCSNGQLCEIHAVSLGTNAANRVARALGLPNATTKVVLHASPTPATGAWHSLNDSDFAAGFDGISANVPIKEVPTPGTEHWYYQDDYAANKAPQCFNDSALFYMGIAYLNGQHRVVDSKTAAHDVWTGPDGVVYHEFGAAANPLTSSGRTPDPSCPDPWWR